MRYHIVNGDELASKLKEANTDSEIIVCRECLSEGPLSGDDLNDFFVTRMKFLMERYNERTDNYLEKSVREFYKIVNIPDGAEVNLWFEDDLFCFANMIFVISLFSHRNDSLTINRIFPVTTEADHWKGFGVADENSLVVAYSLRTTFERQDMQLGILLWLAFRDNDLLMLEKLSSQQSPCFRYLREVCNAHIERFPLNGPGRPERVVKEIIDSGKSEFLEVFSEFYNREGIYGFSDLQLKSIYDEVITNN